MRDYKDVISKVDREVDLFIKECFKAVFAVVLGTGIITMLAMFLMFE